MKHELLGRSGLRASELCVGDVRHRMGIEGDPVEWSVTLLAAKKPVIVLSFADPDAWASNRSKVVSFLRSIRRID